MLCGGDSICNNMFGYFECECATGWEGGGKNQKCTKTDFCKGIQCGGRSLCVNLTHGFRCDCASGWRLPPGSGNGLCEDINECQELVPLIPANETVCGGASVCTNAPAGIYIYIYIYMYIYVYIYICIYN